jgi:hypothetical protein
MCWFVDQLQCIPATRGYPCVWLEMSISSQPLPFLWNIDAGRAPGPRVRQLDQVDTPHEAN